MVRCGGNPKEIKPWQRVLTVKLNSNKESERELKVYLSEVMIFGESRAYSSAAGTQHAARLSMNVTYIM